VRSGLARCNFTLLGHRGDTILDSLLLLQIAKAIVEIALMFFAARGLLVLLFLPARHKLDGNVIYQLFVKGTQPFVSLMRLITPRFVLDRHLPYAACAVLLVAWFGLSIGKLQLCAEQPKHQACEALTAARGTTSGGAR
jgi:hypothetical protein